MLVPAVCRSAGQNERRLLLPLPFGKKYYCQMIKLLEQGVEKVRALPLEMQDRAARILRAYVGDEEPVLELTPEEEAYLSEAQAEMQRGEFATDAEVEAVFSKYRL
jgi:hypothetical protein